MAVKLFAAEHIQTEFYITLDSDIRLVRPVNNASMFLPNGKAYTNWNDRGLHPDWIARSEEMLKGKGCVSDKPDTKIVGVTPQVLHRYLQYFATCSFLIFSVLMMVFS